MATMHKPFGERRPKKWKLDEDGLFANGLIRKTGDRLYHDPKTIEIGCSFPSSSSSVSINCACNNVGLNLNGKADKLFLPLFCGWSCFIATEDAPFDLLHLN